MPSKSSTPDEEESGRHLPERILVASVLRPHGIRGDVKIEVASDVPERFAGGSELSLVLPRRGQRGRPVRVRSFRPIRGGAVLGLEDFTTREQAEEIRGARLEVERSQVPEAPPDTFYYYELEGCRCFETEAGELGEVLEVLEDGGGHLLRIADDRRELLVPFVRAFLVRVDVADGRIDLELPPGLIETCASESSPSSRSSSPPSSPRA